MSVEVPTSDEFRAALVKIMALQAKQEALTERVDKLEAPLIVIPSPPTEPPITPQPPIVPPPAASSYLKYGELAMPYNADRREFVLPDAHKVYSAPHPTLGFAFNLTVELGCDHGGNVYQVMSGRRVEVSGFHGGFTARQWSDQDPTYMHGFIAGSVYGRKVGDSKPEYIVGINEAREEFPEFGIKSMFAGVNEGRFVRKGIIYLTVRNDDQGWLLKYSIPNRMWLMPIEIETFNWRSGRPDFYSCAIKDDYTFYKAVIQNTENTKTPWIIADEDETYRSTNTMLYHTGAWLYWDKEKEQYVDANITIGGQMNRLSDGAFMGRIPNMSDLSYHVGALDGRGQGFFIHDNSHGDVMVWDGDRHNSVASCSGNKVHYVAGGAIKGRTAIMALGRDGKRRFTVYTQ